MTRSRMRRQFLVYAVHAVHALVALCLLLPQQALGSESPRCGMGAAGAADGAGAASAASGASARSACCCRGEGAGLPVSGDGVVQAEPSCSCEARAPAEGPPRVVLSSAQPGAGGRSWLVGAPHAAVQFGGPRVCGTGRGSGAGCGAGSGADAAGLAGSGSGARETLARHCVLRL